MLDLHLMMKKSQQFKFIGVDHAKSKLESNRKLYKCTYKIIRLNEHRLHSHIPPAAAATM